MHTLKEEKEARKKERSSLTIIWLAVSEPSCIAHPHVYMNPWSFLQSSHWEKIRAALMAANDYRAYLRNHIDMDEAPARVAHTGSTHRALIFITLAIMGLLQVASSVAILLHLTGYLREVRNKLAQQVSKDGGMHPGENDSLWKVIVQFCLFELTAQHCFYRQSQV